MLRLAEKCRLITGATGPPPPFPGFSRATPEKAVAADRRAVASSTVGLGDPAGSTAAGTAWQKPLGFRGNVSMTLQSYDVKSIMYGVLAGAVCP